MLIILFILYIVGCIFLTIKEFVETKSFINAVCALILSIVLTPIFAPKMIRETRP